MTIRAGFPTVNPFPDTFTLSGVQAGCYDSRMTIGKKIRQLRQGKGWSLAELAKHSGVALSTLSRIETGKMTGTLESHTDVARAMGVRLTELYASIDPAGPAAEMHREEEPARSLIAGKETRLHVLTGNALQKEMLPLRITLPPKKSTPKERAAEGTEKFLYLLKGQLEVVVGEERFRLKTGDSVYFQASLPHLLANPGTSAAVALCVSSPPAL